MLPEDHVVFHVYDVHCVVGVIVLEELQNFQFNASLIIVLFLVFYNLERHMFLSLVIEALDCDSEGATAKVLDDLVAVGDVVFQHDPVVSFGVIVATVVVLLFLLLSCLPILRGVTPSVTVSLARRRSLSLNLFDTFAKVVDLRKVENLCLFVLCEMSCTELLQALGRRHWDLHLLAVHCVLY